MSLSSISVNNQQVVGVDDEPVDSSHNLVESGGVYESLMLGDEIEINLSDYENINAYISANSTPNTWYVDADFYCKIIPINSEVKYKITANSERPSHIAFLTNNEHINKTRVKYASGESYFVIEESQTVILETPSDATYMFVGVQTRLGSTIPSSITQDSRRSVSDILDVVEDTPVEGSKNLITSGGVYPIKEDVDEIKNKVNEIKKVDSNESDEFIEVKHGSETLVEITVDYVDAKNLKSNGEEVATKEDINTVEEKVQRIDTQTYEQEYDECFEMKDGERSIFKINSEKSDFHNLHTDGEKVVTEMDMQQVLKNSGMLDKYKYSVVKFTDFENASKTDSEILSEIWNFMEVYPYKHLIIDRDIHIDEAILIPSNTILELQADIYQNDYVFDNILRGANIVFPDVDWSVYQNVNDVYPTEIEEMSNIKIIGNNHYLYKNENPKIGHNPVKDTDEPMVADDWGSRVFTAQFTLCKYVEIKDLYFRRSQSYTLEFDFCQYVSLNGLNIVTPPVNSNLDGIDLRTGCKHFRIENIYAETGDDALAINTGALIDSTSYPKRNRYLYPLENYYGMTDVLYAKDKSLFDVEDIYVYNYKYKKVDYDGSRGCILLSQSNKKIHDVFIDLFEEQPNSVQCNEVIKLYTTSAYAPASDDNSIYNIRLNNLTSKSAKYVLVSTFKCNNVWANKLVSKQGGQVYSLTYQDGFTITNSLNN